MKVGRHKIELDDPIGDVRENDGKPGKEVVKVSITNDGENIHIISKTIRDAVESRDKAFIQNLAKIFLA